MILSNYTRDPGGLTGAVDVAMDDPANTGFIWAIAIGGTNQAVVAAFAVHGPANALTFDPAQAGYPCVLYAVECSISTGEVVGYADAAAGPLPALAPARPVLSNYWRENGEGLVDVAGIEDADGVEVYYLSALELSPDLPLPLTLCGTRTGAGTVALDLSGAELNLLGVMIPLPVKLIAVAVRGAARSAPSEYLLPPLYTAGAFTLSGLGRDPADATRLLLTVAGLAGEDDQLLAAWQPPGGGFGAAALTGNGDHVIIGLDPDHRYTLFCMGFTPAAQFYGMSGATEPPRTGGKSTGRLLSPPGAPGAIT